ncbi:hypothetical protein DSM112329_01055 [Paraconexibacter sp. AEG42_29]|uniref:Major facilitator superfamily (MFS) profile domain-containing protein n=1 Tax=Paraconexibacter sp. AEG42_29 TaxID=2997339 RepID=A0AAU7ARL4_9ACTN
MRPRSVLLAVAAGLALADASIVTLALPELLVDLDTTVQGVAAVIGVYTVVLALVLVPVERLAQAYGATRIGAAGFVTFAVASLGCAVADSLPVLLAARSLQAAGGAAALVTTFSLLSDHDPESNPTHPPATSARNLWLGAAVLSAALGPALGGALTQAFSWPAIFLVNIPVALAAAGVCLTMDAPAARAAEPAPAAVAPGSATLLHDPPHTDWRAAAALGMVSAALSAVLFLLVLLLVAGWAVRPLAAAATVTVVPLFALAGSRLGGDARWRAAAGCALVGLGTLALAFLPDARVAWTIAPQALAGFGMGLALPALGGELLPERDARDAARLLSIRHIGIAVALAVIAPITAARLDDATFKARESGVALVLDAEINPTRKLQLAPALLASVDAESPRAVLRKTIAENGDTLEGVERAEYDRLAARADETLVDAVGESFFAAFLITGLLALGGAVLLVSTRLPPPTWAIGAAILGCVVLAAQVEEHHRRAPDPVPIADPCQPRPQPATAGGGSLLDDLANGAQASALASIDTEACQLGSSREELLLAFVSDEDAERFEREHGTDARSVGGFLGSILRALVG